MTDEAANAIANAIHDEHDHPNPMDESDYARWAAEYREERKNAVIQKMKNHNREKRVENGFFLAGTGLVIGGAIIGLMLMLLIMGIGVGMLIQHFRC